MSRETCPRCNSATALGEQKCFKCGYIQKSFSSGMFTTSITIDSTLKLPSEIVFNPNEMSPMALQWLAKGYIFNVMITKQFIGYCPAINKVFLPAIDENTVVHFYQLRSLDPKVLDKYKYLTYGKTADYLIHYRDHISSSQVFIVEDHLSAIRLRKFGNVIALSGTCLSHKNAQHLVQMYSDFTFWLDSDSDKQPGQRPGRQALFKNLRILQNAADKFVTRSLFRGVGVRQYSFSYINYDNIIEDPKAIRDSRIANIITSEVIHVSPH